jgi:AraC family transcriptional activator of pobA
MQKVKNTIPVYDICSINGHDHLNHEIIAEPFASYLRVHPNLRAPHRHTFYHVVLFTKGSGFHTVDFEQFPVSAGQIYFMSPGQVHSWNFEGEVDGYIINFSDDLLQNFLSDKQYLEQFTFFRSIARESVYNLDDNTFVATNAIFKKIIAEVATPAAFTADLICASLVELFITVQRSVRPTEVKAIPQQNQLILYNFRKLVNTWYAEKRLPKDYAAMLYITPNHLNALCKDLLGKPAGEVIRDRILLEAKRLLVNAELSISEIAFKLAFTDNSHFTRFFKKHTGQTPEEFKKTSLSK